MKLQELAVQAQAKTTAKVFESYFGTRVKFDTLTRAQTRDMLNRVRSLVQEHRRTPDFHHSERNANYLKLVMLEQVLATRLRETSTVSVGSTVGATQNQMLSAQKMSPVNPTTAQGDAAKRAQNQQQALAGIKDPKQQAAMKKSMAGQNLTPDEQKEVAALAMVPKMESRQQRLRRQLKESEVQQAQVVLASQDMVDQVQKMLEQVTAMQFKDLPALVDQVKNQIGVDQAMQFNTDATAALAGLVQNLQGSKLQLEQALGVVTGQGAVVPGQVAPGAELDAAAPGAELGAELPPAPVDDIDIDADIDIEEPKKSRASDLGRARR